MIEYTCYGPPDSSYGDLVPACPGAELITKTVAVGIASAQSDVFPAGTVLVILMPDEDCRIAFGTDPTASNTGTKTRKLFADTTYSFAVERNTRFAVIQMEA